ncbi:MAG: exodeoxyribonuclease VII large subunit [Clostridia bacterium]|nr:exodeoxyribonuclease VII large subunit [Clostridia bacterium]
MKILTLTVLQFNSFIKKIFDAEEFLSNIAIIGEITNFKISGGNAFFDLKDEQSMISCVKFGAYDLNVKNGDLVTVYGKINFYVKSGKVNFLVRQVNAYGQGDLYQKFIMLKEKLEKDGYFREEIKKQIPKFSKNVGIVTSETGAVIRDIINVTKSKNPFTNLIVYPSKVQGVNAENEISQGISYFNLRDDIDVIIIARGGGSLEDLAPFNTEKIVKAIFESKKPIISAVGHETDFTLCDFASDLRVPTPSVAAEVAVFDYEEQLKNINRILELNYYYLSKKIENSKQNLKQISNTLIDKLTIKVNSSKAKLDLIVKDISSKINQIKVLRQASLENVISIISKLNPLEILKNGYSVLEKNNERVISIKNINVGDDLKITINYG